MCRVMAPTRVICCKIQHEFIKWLKNKNWACMIRPALLKMPIMNVLSFLSSDVYWRSANVRAHCQCCSVKTYNWCMSILNIYNAWHTNIRCLKDTLHRSSHFIVFVYLHVNADYRLWKGLCYIYYVYPFS